MTPIYCSGCGRLIRFDERTDEAQLCDLCKERVLLGTIKVGEQTRKCSWCNTTIAIQLHGPEEVTHGICDLCGKKYFPEYTEKTVDNPGKP